MCGELIHKSYINNMLPATTLAANTGESETLSILEIKFHGKLIFIERDIFFNMDPNPRLGKFGVALCECVVNNLNFLNYNKFLHINCFKKAPLKNSNFYFS